MHCGMLLTYRLEIAVERRVCSRLVSYRGPLVKNPFILEAEQFLVRNLEPIVRDYSVSTQKW